MTTYRPAHRVRRRLAVLVSLAGALVLAGGGGLAALESNAVSSYGEGVWWALSLMTTVGFVGDTPETTAGRVVSAVLMVAGFMMLTITTATVASMLVREDEEPERVANNAFEESVAASISTMNTRLQQILEALEDRQSLNTSTPPDPAAARHSEGQQVS